MRPLSAVIITFNEEANIRDCIESVRFADEVIVIDSASTDRTVEIAESCGARVLSVPWSGYARAKNFGIDQASHDWILLIDADERVSQELAKSIRDRLALTPAHADRCSGYRIARKTWYMNRWIRGSGWYPDWIVRLFDRTEGRVRDVPVHESVTLSGKSGRLSGDLLHQSYRSISDHVRRIDKYTTLAAQQWASEGRRASIVMMLLRPGWEFLRKFIFKLGFLDGVPGLIIAGMHAWYIFLKYAKTYELSHSVAPPPISSESDSSP